MLQVRGDGADSQVDRLLIDVELPVSLVVAHQAVSKFSQSRLEEAEANNNPARMFSVENFHLHRS